MSMSVANRVRWLRTQISNAKLKAALDRGPHSQQDLRRKIAYYQVWLSDTLPRLPPIEEAPPPESGSNVPWVVFKRPQGDFIAVKAPTLSDRRRVMKAARNRKWSGGRYYREVPAGVTVAHV